MLPTIYLIRHGVTKANVEQIIAGGNFETDLLEEGVRQAKEAGVWLKDKGIKSIYGSTLKRVRQTIEAMNLPSEIPISYDSRLKEMGFAEYEGTDFRKIPEHLRLDRMFENRELRRGSGENVRELCQRVSEFIEEKVRGLSAPVLLVGHGVTNRALLNVLLPEKREELMSVRIDNCSIWRVEGKNYEKVFSPNLA